MSEQMALFIIHVPIQLFIYVIGLIMPYLTRKELVFSIRFPKSSTKTEPILRLKSQYLKGYGIVGGIFCIVSVVVIWYWPNPLIAAAIPIVQLAVMVAFFLVYRKKAEIIKASTHVTGGMKQVAIADTGFHKNITTPSLFWFLLPLAIVGANFAIIFFMYDQIPDPIPMHWNLKGEIDRWTDKSMGLLLIMPCIMVFMTFLMMCIYWIAKVAKPHISAETPKESMFQNARFRFHLATFSIVLAVVLNIFFTFLNLQVTTLFKTSFAVKMIVLAAMTIGILIYVIVFSVKIGQGGSRIRLQIHEKETGFMNRDDDRFWKAGIFYCNPDDPSLWVEKRYGVGYTLNFSNNKAIWLIIAMSAIFLLIPIVIILLAA